MTDSPMKKIKRWIRNTMGAMGDAMVSVRSKSEPPNSGEQPFKDTPKKGLL